MKNEYAHTVGIDVTDTAKSRTEERGMKKKLVKVAEKGRDECCHPKLKSISFN